MELPLSHLFSTLLLLLRTSSLPQPVSSAKHTGNFTDLDSLLAFRSHVHDPRNILAANWTADTSFCNWIGVRCSRRRQRVVAIELDGLSLRGSISPHVGNLSFLLKLNLYNNSLTGPIPESIGSLPRLASIILESNSLTGLVPSSIFNMSSLIILYASFNHLSGYLPSNNSFVVPPRLRRISLNGNRLTGNVLPCLLQYRNVQVISLSDNQFGGTLTADIGILQELVALDLGGNQLIGTIPSSLGNLTKLDSLDLSLNYFSGIIPEEFGSLANLENLDLSRNGNITGSIPTSLLNISMLYSFGLGGNKLTGSVPAGIGKSMPMLQWFHVGLNKLSGGLEFLSSFSNCQKLEHLIVAENTLEGALPDDVGNLSANLQDFSAFGNLIRGNILVTLGNLSGLIRLDLGINGLTGTIPSTLAGLESLQLMGLYSNILSGSVPSELGLMKELTELPVQDNKLSGLIPESLANISLLQVLVLGGNNFSSGIPESLWTLVSLLELDLSGNSLDGSLSPQVGNLKALAKLDLSTNRLSGNISSAVGKLQMLTYLDLSKNSFHGQIPDSLGGLIVLKYLNLSSNFLSGLIPESLANISNLDIVDLSFNKLEGQVPNGRVFLNSSYLSLIGNEALCGAPQLHIPPCGMIRNNSGRKSLSVKYILLVTILGVVLLMFLCLVYAFYSRRKVKSLAGTNVPHLDYHRSISHHELVRATGNFSEANLIGRGGFGAVFKGCLDDGLIVAIKVLNLNIEGSSKSFDAECQVLKIVRHKNLIKIISVCSNLDFKALILEYMPNGSLEQCLYSGNYFLNLIQRLNIMVDVSLALEYLHHHHPQVVLHCDLKPTNILLDEEMVAHVSDFGIAKLLLGDSKSMATASMPGTLGYIAPEYAIMGTASRMGDVYSFGILLLETFTGKKPINSVFGEQSNLREWICHAHPNATMDVVDKTILRDDDTNDVVTKIHRCLTSIIELGLVCSSYSPKERIPMTEVARRLQKIKMEYLSAELVLES